MPINPFSRPYVISWNLTYRCNLACEHCYLDAGPKSKQVLQEDGFSDRSELPTQDCFRIIDQITAFAPECVTILTGGEPLLRKDIIQIIQYAKEKSLWVVVGSNGVLITETLVEILKKSGVRGMALSLDALHSEQHDAFRVVKGAWRNTIDGAKTLNKLSLPFIIQTTVAKHNFQELEALSDFAYADLGAKVWNLYFLVSTGRGQFVSDLTPSQYDQVLSTLSKIQKKYHQKMLVNAKCAPHYITNLLREDLGSPFLKNYSGGAGGCPAGTHYMGIRPNGDVTPCPYLPVFAGNLKSSSLTELWNDSSLFTKIRSRNNLGGKCGSCECSSLCGGCRARAYGAYGDFLAEDPLCNYEVGSLQAEVVSLKKRTPVEYGHETVQNLDWEPLAKERMQNIPAFVRGMVIQKVENYCKSNGISLVNTEVLGKIRANIPTSKVFGKTNW